MECRACRSPLTETFLDLGYAPPSNAYRSAGDMGRPEKAYPLKVRVCRRCWLAQAESFLPPDALFDADYAYLSSTSSTWLAHARHYAGEITAALNLGADSLVVEIASNDGYLLREFVRQGIPCLGVEPAAAPAAIAESLGIPVLREFFSEALARRLVRDGRQADLIVGNNVYAHVPDINDLTRGLKILLAPGGVITLEFPHLMQLLAHTQFDTVYHEHFSYLSLHTASLVFARAGLRLFDVEQLPTHGGSLRIHGCHAEEDRAPTARMTWLLDEERQQGLQDLSVYRAFQARADRLKDDLLAFLIEQKRAGRRVVAYGAAAKGNTLLNYAGIKPDLLSFVCDAAASKQGKFMPGSHLPILPPSALADARPDFILILPWNIADEVQRETRALAGQARYLVAVPELRLL